MRPSHGLTGSYPDPKVRFADVASDLLERRFLPVTGTFSEYSPELARCVSQLLGMRLPLPIEPTGPLTNAF